MSVINVNNLTLKENWALALMQKGCVVKVSIKGWNPTTTINLEDFGVKHLDSKAKTYFNKYVSSGRMRLFPHEVFDEIGKIKFYARKNLYDYSFATAWGRFLPYSGYHAWKENDEKLREEFEQVYTALCSRYSEIVSSAIDDYRIIAKDVWYRLYPNSEPNNSFLTDFATNMAKNIPNKNDLMQSFSYDVTFLEIPLPSQIQGDYLKARKIADEVALQDYKLNAEIKAMQEVQDYCKKQASTMIDEFIKNTVCDVRSTINELCEVVLSSISGGKGKLNKRDLEKLRDMTEKFKCMNFFDDPDITSLMKRLDSEINKVYADRNNDDIKFLLSKIEDATKKELNYEDCFTNVGVMSL